MNPLYLTLGIGLGSIVAGAVPPVDAQQVANGYRWTGAVPAGGTIAIKGINGSIPAEPTAGRDVEVVGVWIERDAGENVRIELVRSGDDVPICALYAAIGGRGTQRCLSGPESEGDNDGFDTRIDFVVGAPRGVNFLGVTLNGDVVGRDHPADAHVSTVNGKIVAAAAEVVEAATVNGDIALRAAPE